MRTSLPVRVPAVPLWRFDLHTSRAAASTGPFFLSRRSWRPPATVGGDNHARRRLGLVRQAIFLDSSVTGRPSSISRTRVEYVSCSASASNRWHPARESRASRIACAAPHRGCRARAQSWICNLPRSCHRTAASKDMPRRNLLLEF